MKFDVYNMRRIKIRPSGRLYGRVTVPGDKSISHRALMLGSIARGRTKVTGLAECDDCDRTADAFRKMGVSIDSKSRQTIISGVGLRGLSKPKGCLQAGESGTTMRLLAGILAAQGFESVIDCHESLSKRPMKRITVPLSMMGSDIRSRPGGYPPLTIRPGDIRPIDYRMNVPSAQVKSAILLAGLYSKGITSVEESFRSRDHTERMMKYFGASLKVDALKITLRGGRELAAKSVVVPGDISSASFFIVGAILLKGSKVTIENVGINPTRAGILNVLSRMGARCRILKTRPSFEPSADIEVLYGPTHGTIIDRSEIPLLIDELPILFVLASLSIGRTIVKGAQELRVKETDRIYSMIENLGRMGARISARGGNVIIDGVGRLRGAPLKSFNDHRTAMSMSIAALAADGDSSIEDFGCVRKSFPGFLKTLDALKR